MANSPSLRAKRSNLDGQSAIWSRLLRRCAPRNDKNYRASWLARRGLRRAAEAADLVQEIAERVLDMPLDFRGGAVEIELELAFHEMHQLLVALRQMLMHDQRVVDQFDVGHDAEAGIGLR